MLHSRLRLLWVLCLVFVLPLCFVTIPWTEIEKRYGALFTNRKGNIAKPLRLALGACIIQTEYGYSDEENTLQIQENPYLQYFCGYADYDDSKLPFDPSLMVYFRKRLTPEVLGEINEMILRDVAATEEKKDDNDDNDDGGGNSGTLKIDANLRTVERPVSSGRFSAE